MSQANEAPDEARIQRHAVPAPGAPGTELLLGGAGWLPCRSVAQTRATTTCPAPGRLLGPTLA
eukprot:4349066-Lingulodinium_polyedra.AAC.1